MITKPTHPGTNALIAALPADLQRHFAERATRLTLRPGKLLSGAEQPIEYVYFPISAVLSILSVMPNRIAVETAVVGYEGMSPLAAFHHVDRAAEQVIVQVPGDALRMARNVFHAAVADVPLMHALLHRFSQAKFTFAAQSSACNRQHTVVQRCARWMLTTHDRVPGDEFYLTHLFLSQMLGVRRSSVTVAAEVLRTAGAINYTRGRVRVVDREILHQRSCACYDIIRSTYDRLLAGRDTPSPLATVALSDGDVSLATGGVANDPRTSPPGGAAAIPADASLVEFSQRLREARQRSEQLRAAAESPEPMTREAALRLVGALSIALEDLSVAEEEMRVQLESLSEMRAAVEVQQELWRARFDGLPDAFIETDQDDTIVEINRAAEDLLGRPRRNVLGKPVTSLVPDTGRRSLREVITQLRRGGRSARWSGTLIGRGHARPEVEVAVAAAALYPPEAREADARVPADAFVGARWLLRRARPARIEPAPKLDTGVHPRA